MSATGDAATLHPSAAHPVGTWSETTYGAWGSQTITVTSCLRRDCDWVDVTRTGPDPQPLTPQESP